MSLRNDKRQNIQFELDFSCKPTGEARKAEGEETESLQTVKGPESPVGTDRLMGEVCERENLKEALRRVKANKGSSGVDGMTVGQLTDYLKQHWPGIREQLLKGAYEPKPVKRVEIPKPDGAGSLYPASGNAGSAEAVGPDVLRTQLWFSTWTVSASSCRPSAAVYR
jgi:RNA-directed DNA polymerase